MEQQQPAASAPPAAAARPRRSGLVMALLLLGIAISLALVWRGGRRAFELGRARTHAPAPAAATPAAP